MSETDTAPQIFDPGRRAALRARAASRADGDHFLWKYMAEDLADRLAYVQREFKHALILGPMGAYASTILGDRNVTTTIADIGPVQEDQLPYPPGHFDLIITAGTLDSVNDLPGALIQLRRCLRPDGLLLGNMFGAGSLRELKAMMLEADAGRAVPHIHPQIDLRSAADLLTRAGFALPVADVDNVAVRYTQLHHMLSDLRDMGVGNALTGMRAYFGKAAMARLQAIWDRKAGTDEKVEEQFVLLNFSGWSPSPDQPRAAPRGSGTVSLASILKPRDD